MKDVIKKIDVGGLVKALGNATDAMNNFGSLLGRVRPKALKKKRGAGYTKRRISKRTGKSSSH